VSTAAVHDLTDEIPAVVQIAVPKPSRPPHIAFPPTKVFRFGPETFALAALAAQGLSRAPFHETFHADSVQWY
jgi:hypothetical protein